MDQITDTDITRSRADPRFKQILLARTLEQLLGTLHRLQRDPANSDPVSMREGAMMAVRLADMIHAIDEKMRQAAAA